MEKTKIESLIFFSDKHPDIRLISYKEIRDNETPMSFECYD